LIVHRHSLNRTPALRFPLRDDAAASTASHPNVRDDRDTPLQGDETSGIRGDLGLSNRGNVFADKAGPAKSD
jgi:hypothetical protein